MDNILGHRIKSLREEKELSQLELAKTLNINNSTLSQYEAGNRAPSDEIKKKIAKYFNVSLDFLMGNSDIKNPYKEVPQTADEKLRAFLSDPDMRAAFQDYGSWTEEEKQDLIEYIKFKKSKRDKN